MKTIIYILCATWPLITGFWFTFFKGGVAHLDPVRICVWLLFLAVLLRNVVLRKPLKVDSVIVLGSVFYFYTMIHFIFIPALLGIWGPIVSFTDIYMNAILLYFILLNLTDIINKHHLAQAILISGAFICVVGTVEAIAGYNIIGPLNQYSTSEGVNIFRTNGPFFDVIGYASIVLLFIPFTFFCISEKIISRGLGFMLIFFFMIGSASNYSRATIIAMILVLLILTLKGTFNRVLIIYLLVSMLLILGYALFDVFLSSDIVSKRLLDKGTVIGRAGQYIDIMRELASSPVVGIGYGGFQKKYIVTIHNSYFRVLTEFGFIGFSIFIFYMVKVVLRGFSQVKRSLNVTLIKTRISIVLIVFFVGSTIDLLGNRDFILVLMVMSCYFSYYSSDHLLPVTNSEFHRKSD